VLSVADGGHFFAIDRRSWAAVTALGLNPAVAYIVMACGTGKDNRSTAWSVDAVRRHGGLTLLRSQAAVRLLGDQGFLRLTNDGGRRPRYDLLPAKDIAATNVSRKPPESEWERCLLEQVRSGKKIRKKDTYFTDRLVTAGWLVGSAGAGYAIADAPDERPQWLWLPNSLVLGAGNERPPLRRAREIQDVLALRLLVDLYDGENLAEDGGVSRRFIYEKYDRFEVGNWGEYVVWGFRRGTRYVTWHGFTLCHQRSDKPQGERGCDFFPRLETLTSLGLVEWVGMLTEGEEADAQPLHPLTAPDPEGIEAQIGTAAREAAELMVTPSQLAWARTQSLQLVPVPRHFKNVQLFGMARLRYRPQTQLTAAWWHDLMTRGEEFRRGYTTLAERVRRQQYQGRDQGLINAS
jgi:hypothetical protein